MKKLVSVVVCLVMVLSVFSVSAATMYATDGRSTYVPDSEVALWESVGWYRAADTITVYAADGRTKIIPKVAFDAWHAVGWYSAPVMTVYATDGRTAVILKSEYNTWKKAGWIDMPVEQKYAGAIADVCNTTYHFADFQSYVLYDINKDGVKEIIIDDGNCEAERKYYVYTIKNGDVVYVGSFYGGHTYLAHIPNSNGVLVLWGHQGYFGASRVEMVNGGLVKKTVRAERFYSGEYPEAWDIVKGSFGLKMTYVHYPEWN